MEQETPHCLVVGVGKGTGLACVRRFVAGGYKVSMIARHRERQQSFADDIPGATAYPADIADPDGYRSVLRQIGADHGTPKTVVRLRFSATAAGWRMPPSTGSAGSWLLPA